MVKRLATPYNGAMSSKRNAALFSAQGAEVKPVVVVDAGRVLVDFDLNLAFEELTARGGKRLAFPPPPDLERLFFQAEVSGEAWAAIPPALNARTGLILEPAEWRDIWCSVFTGEVPGMREVLAELKTSCRIVALSNTSLVHWEFILERYPIFGLLDDYVVSYAAGAAKPDPAIYQELMSRHTAGRPPLFYTDDMPAYVEAARAQGWDAAVFRDAGQFREEVGKRIRV